MVTTTTLVATVRIVLPPEKICPDFIAFWTAGELLRAGESPYDAAGQTRVQHQYGWDKTKDGAGLYDFMPYYYPPWLGLLCVPLLPLGYGTARITWFVVQLELLALSGYLLRDRAAKLPHWGPLVLAPLFAFSLLAALLGQVTPLILLLAAAAWRLLEVRWDGAAGWMLAGLMTKPQLTVALVPAVLLWSVKRGRWGVLWGFVAGLLVLGLAGTCLVPDWPLQMLQAPARSPLVTSERPWMSTNWYSLLRSAGLTGWSLWSAYVAAAIPVTGLLLRSIGRKTCPLSDLFSLGLLGAFFIAPYAREYDQTLLLIPLLVLVGRLPPLRATVLLVVCIVLPAFQLYTLTSEGAETREVVFLWIPLLLTVLWFSSGRSRDIPGRVSTKSDTRPRPCIATVNKS